MCIDPASSKILRRPNQIYRIIGRCSHTGKPHVASFGWLAASQLAVLFSHIISAPVISQSAVFFSHNKSAPTTRQPNGAYRINVVDFAFAGWAVLSEGVRVLSSRDKLGRWGFANVS
jgi:hypothetical protein